MNNQKIFLIVRRDLAPGVQLAQACHVAIHFTLCYPDKAREWSFHSNNLVVLDVADERELAQLLDELPEALAFREPDHAYALSAIALGALEGGREEALEPGPCAAVHRGTLIAARTELLS